MEAFDEIRIRDLLFFDRLLSLKSITAVAQEMRVPKATASRWLARLEDNVGRVLVKRTTQGVVVSEQGRAFAPKVRNILAAVQAAKIEMNSDMPQGTIRVSVPVPMGRLLAGPVIAEFRRRLPAVRLEIKLQNDQVDLVRDGFDVAIRGGPLLDSAFLAKKLASTSMWLYVSARYSQEALDTIPLIAAPGDDFLLGRCKIKEVAEAPTTPAVLVDDRNAVADALVYGAGRGLLPSFLGEPACKQGTLQRFAQAPIAELPVHALYHPSQRDDLRIHVLIEEVSKRLSIVL